MSDLVTEVPWNRHASWRGLEQSITPLDAFFGRNHEPFPEPPAALDWAGRSLTLAQLRALPSVEQVVTLECAGNGRTEFQPIPSGTPWGTRAVSTGRFRGVPLAVLLQRWPPEPTQGHLLFTGADRGARGAYERSLSVAEALELEAMVAWEMNGQPLALHHGAPWRLIVPGYYAMASVKWLVRVSYSETPSQGHYQTKDYLFQPRDSTAPERPVTRMLLKSLLLTPRPQEERQGGVTVTGWAWCGQAEVEGVHLVCQGVDGSVQREADLGPSLGRYAWRAFRAEWELAPGDYRVRSFCRAGGRVQPEQAPWNRQGYENNSAPCVEFRVAPR